MANSNYVSFKPSDYVEGSGLLNDIDVTISALEFLTWNYNGKGPDSPALKVTMELPDGNTHEQFYTVGSATDWGPSDDGKSLVARGNATHININSNMGIFMKNLVEAGFPEDKIGSDCSVIAGTECHVIRIPVKREGLVQAPRADGKVYEQTVLVVDSIAKLPGDGKKVGAGKGKAGTATSKAKASKSDKVEEAAIENIMEVLAEAGTEVPKSKLASTLFTKMKGDANRNAVVQLVHNADFAENGPWNFDGENFSL